MKFSIPCIGRYCRRRHMRRTAEKAVLIALIGVTAVACIGVLTVSWNQIFAMNCHDCNLFWAVGRGMLNGLVPYRDLFESKPPGIFVLSSISLLWTDSRIAAGVMVAIATVALAIVPAAYMVPLFKHHSRTRRIRFLCTGLLFGAAMVFYVGRSSFNFMPEQFGALFGALYVLTIALLSGRHTTRVCHVRTILGGACIFGAGFMKEPFVITAVAGGLLLSYSVAEAKENVVYPVLMSGGFLVAALLGLGFFKPYVFIYLKTMLGSRIESGEGSLLTRAFTPESYESIWINISAYSHYIAVLLIAMLGIAFIRSTHRSVRQKRYVVHGIFVVLAVYLLVTSVFTGGSLQYSQHYLFPIPGYIALFFLVMRDIEKHLHTWHMKFFGFGATLLLALVSTTFPHDGFHALASVTEAEETGEARVAAELDALLDRCDVDRYLYIGTIGRKLYGYTKHSPLGPLFFQHDIYFDGEDTANLRAEFFSSVRKSSIIVYDRKHSVPLGKWGINMYIRRNFTETPWPCAKDLIPTGQETLYFRKIPSSVRGK